MNNKKLVLCSYIFALLFQVSVLGDTKGKKEPCDQFFSEVVHLDNYRKLEKDSKERRKWLKEKRNDFKKYYHSRNNKELRNYWEGRYYSEYDKKQVLKTFNIKKNKTKIQLIDRGLRKPDEVVLIKRTLMVLRNWLR